MKGHCRLLVAALLLWHASAQIVAKAPPGASRYAARRMRRASTAGK